MSLNGKDKIKCELCGEVFDVEYYDSINVTINRELKEKIFNGDIYKFTCPFCKHDHYIFFPFVYFDMEKKYMIHQGSLASLMNLYETDLKNNDMLNDFSKLSKDILHLGVDSYRELCSKIRMLDNDLDYKIGTLYLSFLERSITEALEKENEKNGTKYEVSDSYFITNDGVLAVELEIKMNNDENSFKYICEKFDKKLYRNVYKEFKTKTEEVFNFCFNKDAAEKLIYLDDEIEDCKEVILEVAHLENTDGKELLGIVPSFNEGKYNVGELVCIERDNHLEKCLIKRIFKMDLYSYPTLELIDLKYKIFPLELETRADSNENIENNELKLMFQNFNTKGFNEKIMIDSNVIVGAKCTLNPTNGLINTKLLSTKIDDGNLLSIYLEQKDLTDKEASRFIYSLDDVIRLVLYNPDRYDGIIINPESDKIVILNNRLITYGHTRIMCNRDLMKSLLDKLTYTEQSYVGDFNYDVIKRIYAKPTSPKEVAKELNVDVDKIHEALNDGYCNLISVVLSNYLNKELWLMKLKSEDIKEISLVSYKGVGDNLMYKDLLRISPHWFSYTRTDLKENKIIKHWSYKTNLSYIGSKYGYVDHFARSEFENPHTPYEGDSEYNFNLRINFVDGTHKDLSRVGRFVDNGMFKLALAMLKCVPELEVYPDVIALFKSKYLTKKCLSNITEDNICAYMFAESGAMGDPGCLNIITRDMTRYYIDGYGRRTDVSYDELNYLLDDFFTKNLFDRPSIEVFKAHSSNWLYLYLGAGNHLFLRNDMYDFIGDMILDTDKGKMYGKWKRLIGPCGTDESCVVIECSGDALENECDVLCHQVNLAGVMSDGIALSIAKRYPNVEKEYVNFENKKLGEVCFVETDDYVVANCFSQDESFNTDYEALRECLDKLVYYMRCNHKRSVAIPYKYGCGLSNGDWDTVRAIFEEKLKGLNLYIYKLNVDKSLNDDPLCMLYEAVSCLHKKGYEKIRISSYFSPSGLDLRCVISVKDNFDYTGFICEENNEYPIYRYTTAQEFTYFEDEESYKNRSVEELADRILKEYPELKKLGKGKDKKYLEWYSEVLELVKDKKYPYAFSDTGYSIHEAGKIQLTNGRYIRFAPMDSKRNSKTSKYSFEIVLKNNLNDPKWFVIDYKKHYFIINNEHDHFEIDCIEPHFEDEDSTRLERLLVLLCRSSMYYSVDKSDLSNPKYFKLFDKAEKYLNDRSLEEILKEVYY